MDIEDEATRTLSKAGVEKILGGSKCDHMISAGLDQQLQRGADRVVVVHYIDNEFCVCHDGLASL
jgi:hypothetical protein